MDMKDILVRIGYFRNRANLSAKALSLSIFIIIVIIIA